MPKLLQVPQTAIHTGGTCFFSFSNTWAPSAAMSRTDYHRTLLLLQPASPAASVKAPEPQLEAVFDASWSAYMQEAPRLDLVMGGQLLEKHPVLYREVRIFVARWCSQALTPSCFFLVKEPPAGCKPLLTRTYVVGLTCSPCVLADTSAVALQVQAEVEAAAVNQQVVGITFTTGTVSAVLPLLPDDQDLLPPPYEMHVLQQPVKRVRRRTLNNFRVLTLHSPLAPADSHVATDGVVLALKLDAVAAPAAPSAPNSRPVSSKGVEHTAAETPASAPAASPAPAALHRAASKVTPRGKSSHASAGAHASRPPSVLEEASQEAPAADK